MHHAPIITIGGLDFDLSTIFVVLVSCILTFVIARLCVRNLSVENPSKLQNFLEWVAEFAHDTVASAMPLKKAKVFVSLAMTLIMFIFISNLLGLPFAVTSEVHEPVSIAGFEVVSQAELHSVEAEGKHYELLWWKSPTADLSVTMGLAAIVFVLVHYLGVTRNTKHYLKHYFEPYPIFLPLNLIETLMRPVTLGIRLFANIYAGEILISTILMLGWVGIPFLAIWQGFSIFVGAIQAFLFTILTMVYISQAAVHEEH